MTDKITEGKLGCILHKNLFLWVFNNSHNWKSLSTSHVCLLHFQKQQHLVYHCCIAAQSGWCSGAMDTPLDSALLHCQGGAVVPWTLPWIVHCCTVRVVQWCHGHSPGQCTAAALLLHSQGGAVVSWTLPGIAMHVPTSCIRLARTCDGGMIPGSAATVTNGSLVDLDINRSANNQQELLH